jgi:corrinoid protein of di/trimethylamine methyltransferase
MPNRTYINGAFLTLAIGAGLTMAIANPSQSMVKGLALGTDLLLGKDGADLRYIEEAESFHTEVSAAKSSVTQSSATQSNTAQTNATQTSKAQTSMMQSNTAQTSTMQSNTAQTSTMQSNPTEINTIQTSMTQSSTIQSSATQSSMLYSNSLESNVIQSNALQSNATQSNITLRNTPASNSSHGEADSHGSQGLSADEAVDTEALHMQSIHTVEEAVLKGNRTGIIDLTKQALSKGVSPEVLLQEALLPAIRQVGELFERGKYFLPQLIASAEAMKNAVTMVEPLLTHQMDENTKQKPVVIIATVEGDIHDIGKNLVALLLKNNGYQVVDLGKDVKGETIIEAAKAHHASVIALSALMTTTMQKMKDFISLAKAEGINAKIIIGGAVVTKEYADEIGADGYSRDAAGAVHLVESLT